MSLYGTVGIGIHPGNSPNDMVIKFPLLSLISLPVYLFLPDELLPLVDGVMFHIPFLNGGSMNPYIGLPMFLSFPVSPNSNSHFFGGIGVEVGITTKFILNLNNFIFLKTGFTYNLLSPLLSGYDQDYAAIYGGNNQKTLGSHSADISIGWSYIFR